MNTGERKKKTRERIYANILFYGFVMRGLHLRPSAPARKAVFLELQTRFAGRRDAGSARDALTYVSFTSHPVV